jgi:antitoxin Phd
LTEEQWMAIWDIQEAQRTFSEVIEEANTGGPQIIARHGMELAAILSIAEYRALTAHKPDLRAYLLGGPKVYSFEIERDRDMGQDVSL